MNLKKYEQQLIYKQNHGRPYQIYRHFIYLIIEERHCHRSMIHQSLLKLLPISIINLYQKYVISLRKVKHFIYYHNYSIEVTKFNIISDSCANPISLILITKLFNNGLTKIKFSLFIRFLILSIILISFFML